MWGFVPSPTISFDDDYLAILDYLIVVGGDFGFTSFLLFVLKR